MPAINRTRLVNTKYNDGNNYYEDFTLKLGGGHTLIDMINGLGKTFFLQCMAQPMLPNAKFKQEFPLSLLFDKNNNNNTIHSLVEWQLDSDSAYQYALIGFCAYKKETSEKTVPELLPEELQSEFGTLLYVCYYNAPNAHDIEGLPLVTYKADDTKKIMNYKELEKYLKTLQGTPLKDYEVVIHRTKKEHLKALAKLNINSVEWKHLMGINASEANAEKYLRTYTTASSFIQDFLIPTIEESYRLRHTEEYQTEESRAATLMKLRQTLVTLQQKEALESEYLYIEGACQSIFEQLGILKQHFNEKDDLVQRLSSLNTLLQTTKATQSQEKQMFVQTLTALELDIEKCLEKAKHLETLERAYEIKEATDQLANLEQTANEAKTAMDHQAKAILDLENKITYYEGEKLYKEYLNYRDKKVLKEEERAARSKEHSELVADYSYWANMYGNRLLIQCTHQEKVLESAKATLETLQAQKEQANLKSERLKTERNYYEIQLAEKEDVLTQEQQSLSQLQKQFKHLTKEHLQEQQLLNKQAYENLQNEIITYEEALTTLKSQQDEVYIKNSVLTSKLEHIDEKLVTLEEEMQEFNKAQEEILKLRNHYNTYELLNYFNQSLMGLRTTIAKKQLALEALTQKYDAIDGDKGVNLSQSVRGQFARIQLKYGSAVLGIDFLESQDLATKVTLLQQTNLLPYSILLDNDDFQKLSLDIELLRDLEDELIPILNRQALLSGKVFHMEGLNFTAKDSEFFMNVQLKEKALKKLKKEILHLQQILQDLEGQIEVLEKHKNLYITLMRAYPEDKIQVQAVLLDETKATKTNLLKLIAATEAENDDFNTQVEKNTTLLQAARLKAVHLKETLLSLEAEWEALLLWERHESKRQELEGVVTTLQTAYTVLITEQETLSQLLSQLESEYAQAEHTYQSLFEIFIKYRMQLEALPFDIVQDEQYIDLSISLEEVQAKYVFYEKRLTEEAGDVKTLDSLIKELTDAMKQKEKEMCAKHPDFTPSYFCLRPLLQGDYLDYLNILQTHVEKETQLYELVKQKATLAREHFISHKGALQNMKVQFEASYGVQYEGIFLQEGDAKQHLQRIVAQRLDNMQMCQQYEKEKLKAEAAKGACETQLFKVIDMQQKLDTLLYKHDLVVKPMTTTTVNLEYFKVAEAEVTTILGQLNQAMKAYEVLLQEVLAKLEAPELIHFKGDLDKLLTEKPQDTMAVLHYQTLIGGKGGYLENLKAEKARIKLTITALKKDEESFIIQCIQKCEQVYYDLMSLSQLSKIELYGRSQEMIRIIVTPLDEELRFAKMRSYINRLITQVEHIEENKKQAYLASHLTLRELFSAFVVNIKKSDIRIFKVEDIIENSRELPWSRAIGSTGQSNGMYMSIFICLISYIRKLYNPHIGEDSRKFIMLDSPFSGTTAAYIWEPIIKLLDRNNVQLLCVGYDIPNHLMSLFDVKYNLAAQYDTDKKQTIVVENIRSNMNLEQLSYHKFIGEQLML